MTLPTFVSAIDEIRTIFITAWRAANPSYTTGVQLLFDTVPRQPEVSTPRVNVFVRHSLGRQASLGHVGTRRFNRSGIITIQVLSPVSGGFQNESLNNARSEICRSAFEGVGTASGIFFRNARIQQIGSDGIAFQNNVIVEFNYDEIL